MSTCTFHGIDLDTAGQCWKCAQLYDVVEDTNRASAPVRSKCDECDIAMEVEAICEICREREDLRKTNASYKRRYEKAEAEARQWKEVAELAVEHGNGSELLEALQKAVVDD